MKPTPDLKSEKESLLLQKRVLQYSISALRGKEGVIPYIVAKLHLVFEWKLEEWSGNEAPGGAS